MSTLIEIYDQMPELAQATIQRILQECNKSKTTSNFVLDIAKKRVLPVLAKVNPGNELIQGCLASGKLLDVREMDLDWTTTSDLLSAEKASWFEKLIWDVYTRPVLNLLLGIKIPEGLAKNREQRLIIGEWLTIASVIHFSQMANL
jgi:hypothetical protein